MLTITRNLETDAVQLSYLGTILAEVSTIHEAESLADSLSLSHSLVTL